MIYSNACAYAIRAMTRLTMLRPDGYVLLEDLCEGTDLPRNFVAKIFQDLVRNGLLVSAKGRRGGFALARPAEQITLFDIVTLVDGKEQFEACVVGMAKCDDKQPCPQHDEWKAMRMQLAKFLKETTLDMMSRTLYRKLELLGMDVPQLTYEGKPVRQH